MIPLTIGNKSKLPIGQTFDDWEVAGELFDYNGDVNVTFSNEFKV
jgi:hypothetical protein